MNKKIIITRGLSGSGKTTWSKAFVLHNPDYLHISRDEIDLMLSEKRYTKEKEKLIFAVRDFLIKEALSAGFNLVLDETYLVPKRIEQLTTVLQEYADERDEDLDIKIQDFTNVPIKQCIARDKNRRHLHVGENFIRKYYKDYIVPLLKDKGETEWSIHSTR